MIAQLALVAALAAPSLTRLPAAGGAPVAIAADTVHYVFPKHRVDFTGNPVRLTRGDETLTCKRLIAQLDDADQVQTATCQTDVRFERGDKVITCDKAVYEEAASRLTCEGKPVIRNGSMSATGSRLVYDLAQDEVTMDDVQGIVPADQADQRMQAYQRRKPGAQAPQGEQK